MQAPEGGRVGEGEQAVKGGGDRLAVLPQLRAVQVDVVVPGDPIAARIRPDLLKQATTLAMTTRMTSSTTRDMTVSPVLRPP